MARSLGVLAELHRAHGAYARAEPLFTRALRMAEKALGPDHPEVAVLLEGLASLHKDKGAYAQAEPLYLRAIRIREKGLGSDHADVGRTTGKLAALYTAQGAHARAEPLFTRALQIQEKALGSNHPDVADTLNGLAILRHDQGAYAQAEPLYLRAIRIREKELGPGHPAVAGTLNDLADLSRERGQHVRSEALYLRAIEINTKALGPDHPDVAGNLNNLAAVYREQGSFARAEPLYVRALQALERARGPNHPDVAATLNNLALLYREQGSFARAEPLYLRALDIAEKTLGPGHPTVVTALNNLAALHHGQGAYARAEPLYVQALDIAEKSLGPDHFFVARGANNLAALYRDQGAYARAEPLLTRALGIVEKAFGPDHAYVASSLNNLGKLHHAQGAYARAEDLYTRSLAISEKALGPHHQNVAATLGHLAILYEARGAFARAEWAGGRAAGILEAILRAELVPLSSSRKSDLVAVFAKETEQLVSRHVHSISTSRRSLELALESILRRKGRVLDSLAENQATLRAHLTPALRETFDELAARSADLSTRLRAGPGQRGAEDHASDMGALRARIDDLESTLNAASAEFRAQTESATIAKVQAALPRGAALIEFSRYHRFDARRQAWREERYAAYILPWKGPPRWVGLGEAAAIDRRLEAVLAATRAGSTAEAARTALRRLDALLFRPIRGRLGDVSHVLLSPDGRLNLVPFEALIDERGRYLLQERLVSYVTSGRDLLRLAVRRAPRSRAAIVAAPDYGAGQAFVPLPGAMAEAAAIQGAFPDSARLTNGQATKPAFAALTGPAFLHVATHGFYAAPRRSPGPGASRASPAERGMYIQGAGAHGAPEDPSEALDRAGLALAGANVRDDGIMSAREIANLDWWGTELVVLSACETGRGVTPTGQGVYGMRRAMVLAGAQSQVTSLWNVNDSSTAGLMGAFYGELARGTGRAEALRRAKRRLLAQPGLAHPYHWAAFVLAGDWRPLAAETLRRTRRTGAARPE